jgi:hypothetical protein
MNLGPNVKKPAAGAGATDLGGYVEASRDRWWEPSGFFRLSPEPLSYQAVMGVDRNPLSGPGVATLNRSRVTKIVTQETIFVGADMSNRIRQP